MQIKPSRGEVWLARLDPVSGHEQGGRRPCLIFSANLFNRGPAELVVVLPLTSKNRNIPLRIQVNPPEGGLKECSYIMPEMIRSVSVTRLTQRLGVISSDTMYQVEFNVRTLLSLA
jgi:mRNA interferase MazF